MHFVSVATPSSTRVKLITTDDVCVYYQLTKYLLEPPSGNPTKFILKRRTSEEALFKFFEQYIHEHSLYNAYPDFSMNSGVSVELIAGLCEEINRNMSAYDEDDNSSIQC